MTVCNQTAEQLSPAMGQFCGDSAFIYVLRFSAESGIDSNVFREQAQTILYDDIGSTGHFRIAPAHRQDLTIDFLLGGDSERSPKFMPRGDHEIFVAFLIRGDSTPLSEELSIIPKELDEFCEKTGLTFEQVDIRDLYRLH